MNRRQFQRQLSRSLFFRYPKKEAMEILSNYAECFDVGAAEGKTEEALCQEFGNPKEIIRSLAKERPFRWKITPLQALGWALVLFPIIFAAACMNGDMPPFKNPYLMDMQPIVLFLAPVLLFFLLGGIYKEDGRRKGWRIERNRSRPPILYGLLYFHVIGTLFSVCWIFLNVGEGILKSVPTLLPWLWGFPTAELSNYGPHVAALLYSCLAAIFLAILLEFAQYRNSLQICPMMFFNAGILAAIERILWMMAQMSNIEEIPVMLLNGMMPFLWGVILAAGSAALLYVLFKKKPPFMDASLVRRVV